MCCQFFATFGFTISSDDYLEIVLIITECRYFDISIRWRKIPLNNNNFVRSKKVELTNTKQFMYSIHRTF